MPTSGGVVQAVKARYDEKGWLEVAESLNDPLRGPRGGRGWWLTCSRALRDLASVTATSCSSIS